MAADVYGVVACDVNQSPSLKSKSKHRHGRVRVSYDEYEASAVPVGKQIVMGTIPAGATILDMKLWWDALGSGTVLQVGDQYDCDRYIGAGVGGTIGTVTAGCCTMNIVGPVNVTAASTEHIGPGCIYYCDTDILVTVPYAGGAITGTIKLLTLYSTD